MAKFSLQSKNRYGNRDTQKVSIVLIGFSIIGVLFLLLPYFKSPLLGLWGNVSLSKTVVLSDNMHTPASLNECIVTATPPRSEFDTMLISCAPGLDVSIGNNVWFEYAGVRYLVGSVASTQNSNVMVQLYSSSSIHGQSYRFDVDGEKYSAVALGGGALRIEVPSEVEVNTGDTVYHAIHKWPFGTVSGVELEKGSYIKRVYVRLPFSFEKVQSVIIE